KPSLHSKKIMLAVQWSTSKLIHLSTKTENIRRGPILLHDNAKSKYKLLAHSPYFPDLSPTDFHFFRSLDISLTHKRFRKAFQQLLSPRDSDFYLHRINPRTPNRVIVAGTADVGSNMTQSYNLFRAQAKSHFFYFNRHYIVRSYINTL
ncbi:Histone-lysine N-methyltransferase SETMAR, partial [Habropoda laboriosa]